MGWGVYDNPYPLENKSLIISNSVVVNLTSSFSNESWNANSKRLKVVNNIYDVEQLSLF